MTYRFSATLWCVESMATWVFVSLPVAHSEEIKSMPWPPAPGFGSLRVRARVGGSQWATSIFPSKDGSFVLPVKKAVRAAEGVDVGDDIDVQLDLVDAPGNASGPS